MRARGPFDKLRTDGWIRTVKSAFFVALGYLRFVGESTPVQPPVPPEGDDVAGQLITITVAQYLKINSEVFRCGSVCQVKKKYN